MIGEQAFADAKQNIQQIFLKIEELIAENPSNLEPVLTELNYLLNKHDENVEKRTKPPYKLVRDDFDCEKMLRQIRETSGMQDLKVPTIRFKADALSKEKQIPLPNSTRKHKEPLLQWFKIHWDEIEHDIRIWKTTKNDSSQMYPSFE